jgi:hypothetical protein
MPIAETLTVEILGDSSSLQAELTDVANLLDGLQQQLAAAGEASTGLGERLGSVAGALGPLQSVSSELEIVVGQITALSQQPVTLDVQPALAALQELVQAMQGAAQQMAALSLTSAAGPMSALPGDMGVLGGGGRVGGELSPRAYAGGGMVTGPSGIDQVAARLTAGEFVLNRDAVATLGLPALERLNNGGGESFVAVPPVPLEMGSRSVGTLPAAAPTIFPQRQPSGASQTTSISHSEQQFGNIEINVRETADVAGLIRDLRQQGIGLRNRRG